MATNDGVGPERPENPWWSQAAATGEGQPGNKPPQAGSTVSYIGGTVAQTSGKMGMPTEFGRYRVRKQLGGGGMGAVYLVENTELRREEALKVPHFGVGDDPEVRERFLREARAAAKLDHPNLCPVYDVGEVNGVCFLTMRYLKGKLLSDYTGKPQPPRKAVEITAKLAQALESAHAKGVIHRDLKPNNVMMCAGVGPVVMDFGLAKQTKSEDQKLTQSGTTLGTPSYMPPEQVKGELERMGPASDVYSLAVILFEMLTGRLPFKAATVAEVYGMVLHTAAPSPSSLRPGLDPALDAICAKALAKTPEGRYPSMKAFAAALIDFLKTAPVEEGAGNLTPIKAVPAEIFQAQTVAPNQAARRHGPRGETTQRGSKAPLLIRKPASTHWANLQAMVSGAEEREGRSVAGVLGYLVLILLMLGTVGGVGWLVYVVSQKKAAPSSDVVAAPPVAVSEKGKTPDAPKAEPPKINPFKIDPRVAKSLDPDRQAAEWVLSIGGTVKVNEPVREIKAAADLPPQAFRLTEVLLNWNKQVSDAGLAHFEGCKSLTYLNLGGSQVSDAGLAHFQDCKNLMALLLGSTQVSDAGLAHFKDCKNLTSLDLNRTRVSDAGLAHFQDCKNLTFLSLLDDTQVSDAGLIPFEGCKNLTVLWLQNTQVSDAGLAHFEGCTNLIQLFLGDTQVSDAGLANFKDCKNLTHLNLCRTRVSDAGLANFKDCKNLTTLHLSGTQVSDAGLANFKDCKSLTALTLNGTKVTAAKIEELKKALPGCKIERNGM
jgi:eukaryotic-like serine/threonine-protein kinase